jgi:hypothetical protein
MNYNQTYQIYKKPGWVTEIWITDKRILCAYAIRGTKNVKKSPQNKTHLVIEFEDKDHLKFTVIYPTPGQIWRFKGVSIPYDYVDIDRTNKQIKAVCYVSRKGRKIIQNWKSRKYEFYSSRNARNSKNRPIIKFDHVEISYDPDDFEIFDREETQHTDTNKNAKKSSDYETLDVRIVSKWGYTIVRAAYKHDVLFFTNLQLLQLCVIIICCIQTAL